MMDYLYFENRKYPFRELYLNDFKNVVISTASLNSRLMNEDGTYTSIEAQHIDEYIFFYVDDIDIYINEDQLIQKLSKVIC